MSCLRTSCNTTADVYDRPSHADSYNCNSPPRWNRLCIPGYQLLMYRLDCDPLNANTYTLFVTNMVHIWVEERVVGSVVRISFVFIYYVCWIFNYCILVLALWLLACCSPNCDTPDWPEDTPSARFSWPNRWKPFNPSPKQNNHL